MLKASAPSGVMSPNPGERGAGSLHRAEVVKARTNDEAWVVERGSRRASMIAKPAGRCASKVENKIARCKQGSRPNDLKAVQGWLRYSSVDAIEVEQM